MKWSFAASGEQAVPLALKAIGHALRLTVVFVTGLPLASATRTDIGRM